MAPAHPHATGVAVYPALVFFFVANLETNKAGYTATQVACGWAGAIFEVSGAFGQERYSQKPRKRRKSKV